MDRQAWVAITVCVIGLIAWYAYTASHLPPPQPAPVAASPTPGSSPTAATSPSASALPVAATSPLPTPAESAPSFREKTEALANGDVELRLTNRGGAIIDAVLLNHTVDNGNRVGLNAPDRTPIGAIIEQPEEPSLPEFSMEKQPDGSVQFERKMPEGVTVRKRFFFPPSTEKKDNFVAEMDVDFRNDGAQPYNNAGYFITLGSTRPIHPKDMPAYTRLAWYANGKAGSTDVSWFAAQNYPIVGVQKRAAQAFYREKTNDLQWAGMTNQFHSWVGNYGLSIVLLTACVKGVLWPLQNKANRSMRKMSALAPKMQELKEKYKDDPTRMNQEVMKLYKEYGVNPVGSCLPMMIQIPIFFGLFSMLGQRAELRNARFFWVRDLSQPDTLFTIPGLGWIPILGSPTGLPINILPIIMGATNLWLMRMTPKTGDSTQQRVMMFMPLIFLIFCCNFAAALALSYTMQYLFTILQPYPNRKLPAPVLEKVALPGKRDRKARR